jgi:DNA end-binding protein Ku
MVTRPYWKGYLKLSLVTCAVEMSPATSDSDKVKFHTLNRKTGHRVLSRFVDAVTGKKLRDQDEVKGYQRGEDDYVMLEDEDLDHVALESTKTIDIATFTPRREIDWIWLDTPYYLTPNDKVGEEAFGVIRAAMEKQGMVGISRLVLGRRERAVMLEPRGKGIVLWTLRYGDEVRDAGPYFKDMAGEKPQKKSLPLIRKLIKQQTRHWDAKMVSDPVQDKLLDIIRAKKKKQRGKPAAKAKLPAAPEKPSNVISIMDALKKSIEADRRGAKKK